VGAEIAWLVGLGQRKPVAEGASRGAVTLSISATIDGSDRFIFTRDTVYNEHMRWSPPRDVVFNGEPWEDLSQPPKGWSELVQALDLTKATIVTRKGRDMIALEPTADGFDLYLADITMGAGPYEVTISIPRK
jgi:hypothetical protein